MSENSVFQKNTQLALDFWKSPRAYFHSNFMSVSNLRFLETLLDLLQHTQQPLAPPIISWNPEGTIFTIFSIQAFTNNYLQSHFPSLSFSSFRRRLHSLGFHLSRTSSHPIHFSHPKFLRNQKHSLLQLSQTQPKIPSFTPYNSPKDQSVPAIQEQIQFFQRRVERGKEEVGLVKKKVSKFLGSLFAVVVKMELENFGRRVDVMRIRQFTDGVGCGEELMNSEVQRRVIEMIKNVVRNEGGQDQGHSDQIEELCLD